MQTLEQRINSANIDKQQLINGLLAPAFIPGKHFDGDYFKYNTTDRIEKFYVEKGIYLTESKSENEKGASISNFFYNSINKEPLQRIVYGIENSRNLPDELWPVLTKWEAAYFLVGLWNKKAVNGYNSELLEEMPLHLVVYGTVDAGARELTRIHNREKERGEYVTNSQLPYIYELRSTYDKNYTRFINKFYQEKESTLQLLKEIEDIRERNKLVTAEKEATQKEKERLQPTLF